jgi:hypothetical protein
MMEHTEKLAKRHGCNGTWLVSGLVQGRSGWRNLQAASSVGVGLPNCYLHVALPLRSVSRIRFSRYLSK